MSKTPAKTKSLKQRLNRLARHRQLRANGPKFRQRSLAIWTALGTSITVGFLNIPLECSKVDLAFDYPTVEVKLEFRLTLEDVRYCETTQEQNDRVEEGNIEE